MERRRLRLRYYSMSQDEDTERQVDPYHLTFHGGGYYLNEGPPASGLAGADHLLDLGQRVLVRGVLLAVGEDHHEQSVRLRREPVQGR